MFWLGMLLTLWLYATSRAIGSVREVERLTTSADGFKWIIGDLEFGRFAICEFRLSHGEALLALMADVLAALMHKGLLSLDVVAFDGTGRALWRHRFVSSTRGRSAVNRPCCTSRPCSPTRTSRR